MQNIILGLAIGGGIGHYLKIREEGILATRDATYRDYIIRHPEDFPPPGKRYLWLKKKKKNKKH